MHIQRSGSVWRGFGSAGPAGFYAMAEAGLFFDFSDPRTLFTDAAGSAALTTPGQTIGLVGDKSRARSPVTSYAGVQASAGLRPAWGRGPKSRRQMLLQSSSLSTSPWSGAGVSATVAAETLNGEPFWVLAKTNTSNSQARSQVTFTSVAGQSYTLTLALLSGTSDKAHIGIGPNSDGGGGIWGGAGVSASFVSGPGIAVSGAGLIAVTGLSATIPTVITITRPYVNAGVFFGVMIYPDQADSTTNGASVKVAICQLEAGASATPYQKTTTSLDMTEAGYPAYGYARLDGADDTLTVTLPGAITGDLMLFGRNGSWIESGVTLPSGALDLGPTGTALTAGVLALLDDLVGVVIIARTTTTAERALALRYFAARGAAGWLVAGTNVVNNLSFGSDTIWTKGAGWTIAAGVATHAAGAGSDIEQAGLIVERQAYLLNLSIVAVRASSILYVWDGTAYMDVAASLTVGPRQAVFVARASGPLKVRLGADADADIDNVTLKPLTVA